MRVSWKTRSDVPVRCGFMFRWIGMIRLLPSAIALGQFPAIAAAALPIPPTLLSDNPSLVVQSIRVSDLSEISPADWAFQQVTRIQRTLQPHLGWHGARVSFLALFLIAVFRVKTVNLTELATAFIGTAQSESHYKRLQRFLSRFELDYYTIARFVVSLMAIPPTESLWVKIGLSIC